MKSILVSALALAAAAATAAPVSAQLSVVSVTRRSVPAPNFHNVGLLGPAALTAPYRNGTYLSFGWSSGPGIWPDPWPGGGNGPGMGHGPGFGHGHHGGRYRFGYGYGYAPVGGWGGGVYEDPAKLRDMGYFAGPAEHGVEGGNAVYAYNRGYPYDWYRPARTSIPIAYAKTPASASRIGCTMEAGVRVCRGTR